MNFANCLLNNREYEIAEFEALSEQEIAELRHNLICTECLGVAYYRRRSRDGKVACFGSHYHTPGCRQAVVVANTTDTNVEVTVTRPRDERRIIVEFALPNPATNTQPTEARHTPGLTTPRQTRVNRTAVPTDVHMQTRALLERLIRDENFRNSTQTIVVNGDEHTVSELFVNFADVTQLNAGQFHGYWGRINNIVHNAESYWINHGNRRAVSLWATPTVYENFTQSFNIDILAQWAGAYVLIFSELRISNNGKPLIGITDINRCAVILP